jgi:hypothetical protein
LLPTLLVSQRSLIGDISQLALAHEPLFEFHFHLSQILFASLRVFLFLNQPWCRGVHLLDLSYRQGGEIVAVMEIVRYAFSPRSSDLTTAREFINCV